MQKHSHFLDFTTGGTLSWILCPSDMTSLIFEHFAAFCHRLGVIHPVVFVFVFTRYYLPYLPYSFLASDLESTVSPKKLWFLLMEIIIKKSKPVYLFATWVSLLLWCPQFCALSQPANKYIYARTYI